MLTTDVSIRVIAVAAILTQPDDEDRQHPEAYKSRKLIAVERYHPAHVRRVLELLAMLHSLLVFQHYLLGGWAVGTSTGGLLV